MPPSILTLQKAVILAAKEVYSILGEGFKEEIYHKALCIESRERNVASCRESI